MLQPRRRFRNAHSRLLTVSSFSSFLRVPSRGAMSLGQKENDVEDWLPSDFPETADWSGVRPAFRRREALSWWMARLYQRRPAAQAVPKKLLHEVPQLRSLGRLSPRACPDLRASQRGRKRSPSCCSPAAIFSIWGGEQEKWLAHAQRSVVLHHPTGDSTGGRNRVTVQAPRFAASRKRRGSTS